MTQREVIGMVATGVALITAGSVWLWGPIPLLIIGALVIAGALFVDF